MKSNKPRRKRWSKPNLRAYLQNREHRRRDATPKPPSGYEFLTGADGLVLTGADGAYLLVKSA